MLKLASKFAMDIFPSVIATIVGAYIVQHYINNKPPAADAAAAVSTANPKKAAAKPDSKPAERSADLGNTPEPGVRAKGISEKAINDRSASDKAAVEKPASDKAERPSETASIPPTETRRHQPTREKTSKAAPVTVPEPVVAAPVTTPAADPTPTPDANDLARAAIERLRSSEPAARVQESAHVAEPARSVVAPVAPAPTPVPVAASPSLQPLPPPIQVSTPPADNKPAVRTDGSFRPTPPADIPDPRAPLDLRADATDQPAKRPSVADDVLSAAKSMFNSVLPKNRN